MRPPKIDFRFLFYTPKNMELQKNTLFLCTFTGPIPVVHAIPKIESTDEYSRWEETKIAPVKSVMNN